jgi:hypothetical protein
MVSVMTIPFEAVMFRDFSGKHREIVKSDPLIERVAPVVVVTASLGVFAIGGFIGTNVMIYLITEIGTRW